MYFADLTVVIPVKDPPHLQSFIKGNLPLLRDNLVIVVDSAGGELLREVCWRYIKQTVPFWQARKLGYEETTTKFTLNLDVDVIVPEGYVEDALMLLKKDADGVSIFYEDVNHCQGALEFGVSLWKTEVLRRLYDFSMDLVSDGKIIKVGSQAYSTLNNGWCECTYMFRKLKNAGGRLETLPYRAKHLK
jgi:hypothetical protein